MRTFAAAALLFLGSGCYPTVDVDKADLDGYQDWYRVDATGTVPGHGDTYRIIYVNDVALESAGSGRYRTGSVILKEIHAKDGDGPGDLNYIGVMRKLDEAPPGGALDRGWLFTYLGGGADSEEKNPSTCWSTCHAAAPYDGVFLQYGRQ